MSSTGMVTKPTEAAPSWDLESIFSGGSESKQYADFRDDIKRNLEKAKTTLNDLPETLTDSNAEVWKKAILEFQRIGEHIDLASSFVHCLVSENVTDQKAVTLHGEADVMWADWQGLQNTLEKLSVKQSDEAWKKLLLDKELQTISFPLNELRDQARDKMAPELEALVLELSVNGYHGWSRLYDRLSGEIKVKFTTNGKEEELSVGQLSNRFYSADRNVRKTAFTEYENAWNKVSTVAATALNMQGGYRLSLYKNRGWDSVLKEPLLMNRLSEATIHAMWNAVSESLTQVKVYTDAKKKALKIDKFCWYDQFAPMGSAGLEYSYNEASDFIIKHLSSFSTEMGEFSKKAIAEGWIEAEDRAGKADGGYCTGMNLKDQSRIFMTYGNDFGSLTTLAHELGHAYHQWTLNDAPFLSTLYPMGLAETASIFNELRVTDAALKDVTDNNQKVLLLDQILQQPYILFCNIYARFLFDKSFYQDRAKGVVSKERLNELMVNSQKEAFGDILDDNDGYHPLFWASKLHFYFTEAPFYNFPYTFGFLFATGVYDQALKEGTAFAPKYRALLEDTGSMTTEDVAMKHLGIDLTKADFWQSAVKRSLSHVDEFVKLCDELY